MTTVEDLAPLLREGDKEKRSDKTHCGGGCRSVTRGGRGKIVASEDFAASLLLCDICTFQPYVVTPRALCPHVSDLVWGKYVTTKLL